jgi:hypothetical protein
MKWIRREKKQNKKKKAYVGKNTFVMTLQNEIIKRGKKCSK